MGYISRDIMEILALILTGSILTKREANIFDIQQYI